MHAAIAAVQNQLADANHLAVADSKSIRLLADR